MASMIYVTFVEKEGPYLKIWGQTDKNLPMAIEKTLQQMTPQFEQGQCMLGVESCQPGNLCCAKFKDGSYYRARITNSLYLSQGAVEVLFLDYGNRDLVPLGNIRSMNSFSANLISIAPQAHEFILAGFTHIGPAWDDAMFDIISNELRYLDFHFQVVAHGGNYVLITLAAKGQDVTTKLVSQGFGSNIAVTMQQMFLQGALKPAIPIIQQEIKPLPIQPALLTYKSMPLAVGSENAVFVSYVTDGPCLFSVQLQNMEEKLKQLMLEINNMQLVFLDEPPLPGCVCLAKSSEDDYICRAVVTNMVDGNFKVFYVDYGNTEVLPFQKLYQIPFKYVIPKVMATRFSLSGLNNSIVSLDMKCAFKEFVNNKILFMRKMPPNPDSALSLCELWDENKQNALDYIKRVALQSYPDPVSLTRGFNPDIKVSFVYGCKRFYIQLKSKEEELNAMMKKLQEVCKENNPIEQNTFQVGMPCNALYEGDGMFYRAQVLELLGNNIKVRYVDYGNEETVAKANVKSPQVELVTYLRPQAIECCLNGYQNMETDIERDTLFEELILEQDFSMKVVETHSDKVLVDLFNLQNQNVALLLLEKIAKSQGSPALLQENYGMEHRKSKTPPKTPFREQNDRGISTKNEGWRDRKNQNGNSGGGGGGDGNWRETRNTRNENHSRDERNFNRKSEFNQNRQNRNDDSWDNKSQQSNENKREDFRKPRNRNDDSWANKSQQSNESKREDFRKPRNWNGDHSNDFRSENNRNRHSRTDDHNHDNRNRTREGSEKSWSGSDKSGGRFKERANRKPKEYQKKEFQNKSPKSPVEIPDFADANAKFQFLDLTGKTENLSVSWFFNPTNFYCQLESSKVEFSNMMREIQMTYKKRKPFEASVESPVIGLFVSDNALYRATVLEKSSAGYKVFFVDFGNVSTCKTVYQIEKKHMVLPAQAYHCYIDGLKPDGDVWPEAESFSQFFDKDVFQCSFISNLNNSYSVDLVFNNTQVKTQLLEARLAVDLQTNETADFDLNLLQDQQIRCQLASMNKMSDILLQIQPGQFIHATVHNLDSAKEIYEANLQKFIGQFIIAYIHKINNNISEVTLYDTEGQKLQLIEPDEGSYSSICPICPLPIFSSTLQGYVSHATETSIFLQPSEHMETTANLLEGLYQFYETLEEVDVSASVQTVYAVKSPDGNWYRGKVTTIEERIVTVQYVDYGNEEVVEIAALRKLDPYFHEFHMLAIEMSITNSLSLLEQEVEVTVSSGECGWKGDLIRIKENLESEIEPQVETVVADNQEVLQNGINEILPEHSEILPERNEIFPEPNEILSELKEEIVKQDEVEEVLELPTSTDSPLELGFAVTLTHLDNPGQFYLQLNEAAQSIFDLQEHIQQEVSNFQNIDTVSIGSLCAAPFSADQFWYRAQVLDGDSDITTVRFIDFGNTDVLNANTKIKMLPPELLAMEQHARRCSLYLQPVDDEWSCEACKRFEEIIDGKQLVAEIVHEDEKTTFVELLADNINVGEVLLNEKLAKELQLETSSSCTGFFSHLNSPSEFWIQLESACNDLEWTAEQLADAENFPPLQDCAPGTLCAAIFPDDGCWYRARILSNTVAGLEVVFIDYGNSCTCSTLRELPEDLIMLPPLAQKCSLQKPPGILEWPVNATNTLKEISGDGVEIFTVNKLSQGETSVVQLLLKGEDISLKFLPITVDVTISQYNNPDDFYVQLLEKKDLLKDLETKLEGAENWPEIDSEEGLVAAYCEKGKIWRRGRITGKVEGKFDVNFVDYGGVTQTDLVRKLQEDLVEEKIEPFAKKCSLIVLTGFKWSDETKTSFAKLTENVFQAEFVTEDSVRLYLNGSDIRANLAFIKCTPASSVQSSPKKSCDLKKTEVVSPIDSKLDIGEEKQLIEDEIPITNKDTEEAESELRGKSEVKEVSKGDAVLDEIVQEVRDKEAIVKSEEKVSVTKEESFVGDMNDNKIDDVSIVHAKEGKHSGKVKESVGDSK